jgi:hypothetical protein
MIDKVVYIGGVARSGTSWIGQILNSCPKVSFRFQPLFSYEFRGRIDEDSSSSDYESFYQELFHNNSSFLTQIDKVEKGLYPRFIKENESILVFKENRFQSVIEPMLRKSKKLNFIGIIRNPIATLYSWTQNEKEFPAGSDILREWRFGGCKNKSNEDYFGYYKWKEVAHLYLDLKDKYPERVEIIHYDQLLKNTDVKVKELFNKFKITYTSQTAEFLNATNKRDDENYYSVYKGKTDKEKWKKGLPQYIIDEITEDLKGTRLEQFLYE